MVVVGGGAVLPGVAVGDDRRPGARGAVRPAGVISLAVELRALRALIWFRATPQERAPKPSGVQNRLGGSVDNIDSIQ